MRSDSRRVRRKAGPGRGTPPGHWSTGSVTLSLVDDIFDPPADWSRPCDSSDETQDRPEKLRPSRRRRLIRTDSRSRRRRSRRRDLRDVSLVVASTGYELLDRAGWNSQTQPVDASRVRGTATASGQVHHTMMRALPDRRSPPGSAKCDVPVVRRSPDSMTVTLCGRASGPLPTRPAVSDESLRPHKSAQKVAIGHPPADARRVPAERKGGCDGA